MHEPIAERQQIYGFHSNAGVRWTPDNGIVYCAGEFTLVHVEIAEMKQERFYIGHDSQISSFDVCKQYLASTQNN